MFFTLNRFLMVYFITDNNEYIVLGKYREAKIIWFSSLLEF